MKRLKLTKVIASSLIAISVIAFTPTGVNADWIQNDNGRLWYREGNSWATGWRYINGTWYYFYSDGYVRKGWLQDTDGKWYYLYNNGEMAKNTTIEGYYVDNNGVWTPNSYGNNNNNSQSGISLDKNLEKEIRNLIGKQYGDINKEDLLGITELNLYNKNINSLEGIENLVNLSKLNIKNNNISDISALSKLTKLKYLDIGNFLHGHIYYNSITDITPLKSLTNLETLSLSGLILTDIDAISSLVNLKELNLYYSLFKVDRNATSNISPLKNLSNLEILNLGYCNINNITTLQDLQNLKKLGLEVNDISDIIPLKKLNSLKELNLRGNTKIDNNSIQMLQKSLPDCIIEH